MFLMHVDTYSPSYNHSFNDSSFTRGGFSAAPNVLKKKRIFFKFDYFEKNCKNKSHY